MVVWESNAPPDDIIAGQRYDTSGKAVGEEFQVNSYPRGFQGYPEVASDTQGDFVVVWGSDWQDGDEDGVFGQRFDSAGVPLGEEFQVNTYTTDAQRKQSVAMASTGDFVVVWQSEDQDGSGYGIFGQRFDANGVALGPEFQVNTHAGSSQAKPALAGDLVAVWRSYQHDGDGWGAFGQRFLGSLLFADGFESGSTWAWDQSLP